MPKTGITARLMVEAVELLTSPGWGQPDAASRESLGRSVRAVSQAIAGRDATAEELAEVEAQGLPAFLRLVARLDAEQLRQVERPA